MRPSPALFVALAPLALAACGGSTVNQQQAANANAMVPVADTAGSPASVEPSRQLPLVSVPSVPVAPADFGKDQHTALERARVASQAIESGSRGIERRPADGGWVWIANGQVIRTASRDGSQVAYFTDGVADPYFVQHADIGYTYANGAATGIVDAGMPKIKLDRNGRQVADQLARDGRARASAASH